jgi:hypothetical protein
MFIYLNGTEDIFTKVDDIDSDLSTMKWSIKRLPGYAYRNEGGKHVLLHRLIAGRMGLPIPGKRVIHKNGNGLDNRRENIILAGQPVSLKDLTNRIRGLPGRIIFLNQRNTATALVDDEDAGLLCIEWCLHSQKGTVSVQRKEDETTIYLVRTIAKRMGLPIVGKRVIHKNGNGLDNRRSNIALAGQPANIPELVNQLRD